MSYDFGVLVDKVVNCLRISLILIGMRIPYRKRFGTILNSGFRSRTASIVFVYELVLIRQIYSERIQFATRFFIGLLCGSIPCSIASLNRNAQSFMFSNISIV